MTVSRRKRGELYFVQYAIPKLKRNSMYFHLVTGELLCIRGFWLFDVHDALMIYPRDRLTTKYKYRMRVR